MNIQRASVHYKKLDLKIKKRFTDFLKFGNSCIKIAVTKDHGQFRTRGTGSCRFDFRALK